MHSRMSFEHLILLPHLPSARSPGITGGHHHTLLVLKWNLGTHECYASTLPTEPHCQPKDIPLYWKQLEHRSFVLMTTSQHHSVSAPTSLVSRNRAKRNSRGWGLKLTNWGWCWAGEISGDALEGTRLEARQGVSSVISSQEREFGTEITTLLFCKSDLGSLCL